ncbi:glycerophosphoryl diester phosphodiesterase [Curvibacter sp. CHRR-16]|uniref:glycerophosphoryl diester phosphodiesterase n=1 Tax=Curvibacter sp. CHRR-16 TaxID=2835872 RepID=UPI001BDA3839|nr:glycerophosphoryl diester phosphodiesterase [Curvibacter sp. CHRR-16]MBT0569675.1 glycerophosphoryl diester phosphodiesterase [Curvibacter sp. CHRR-16]
MTAATPLSPWPYPRWVAHRGAGKLAPENTLAAFRLGAEHGYRMYECDVKLSADGVPFLLHDDTLERTSNIASTPYANTASTANQAVEHAGQAVAATKTIAGNLPWSTLSQLDAGSWHSRRYAGETLPTLEAIARFCLANRHFLNIEIKPTPGTEHHTGAVVAQHAARLWQGQAVPPLLSSFAPEALAGAKSSRPALPRGLLLEELHPGWLDTALQLQCVAVICDYQLWTPESVSAVQDAGLKALSYTVNDAAAATHLLEVLHTDGIITDRVDLFSAA